MALPAALVLSAVQGLSSAVRYLAAKRSGDRGAAWAAVESLRTGATSLLPDDLKEGAGWALTALQGAERMGVAFDDAKTLVDDAEAQGRKPTVADVQAYVAKTGQMLDDINLDSYNFPEP